MHEFKSKTDYSILYVCTVITHTSDLCVCITKCIHEPLLLIGARRFNGLAEVAVTNVPDPICQALCGGGWIQDVNNSRERQEGKWHCGVVGIKMLASLA